MKTKKDFFNQVSEFINYCNDFYNISNGIYPIADYEIIELACLRYIISGKRLNLNFDSIDRENVRNILQTKQTPIK